ncbi:hypothetical protein [Nonomuraea soli]|uniref:Uncharacterized protein n=1 Tax=Nonomuraea soli TaxID=1032476 RepID=A0A7W0HRM9_9ACTN|nr:hypothetical protein [Nonomuraea soli]MBA2893168.1 hypothetical protein [Nonomuraea soli]
MTADHDRNVGPRGEEEAPRGPAPSTERLAYGELPPEPPIVYEPPPPAAVRRRPLAWRDSRLIGVGAAGVVLGAVLGGSMVAALGERDERGPLRVRWHPPAECSVDGVPCDGPIVRPFRDGPPAEPRPGE